jgi:HJR/Mrr/RecB family endonuclease
MTRWIAVLAASITAAWYNPLGYRWAGITLLMALSLALAWKLRGAILHRRALRTVAGLRALPPAEFEAAVGRWLRRDGWHVQHCGGGADDGIDLLARKGKDTLAVQCKRCAETASVTSAQVRDLYGAAVATGANRALLVTTGRISSAATTWCAELTTPSVHLIAATELGPIATGCARLMR